MLKMQVKIHYFVHFQYTQENSKILLNLNPIKYTSISVNGLNTVFALAIKCALGAIAVLIISVLSKSKAFYIAGLIPLFPTFALIAHVIVAQEQGADALRKTALFGLWSLIPYFIYLLMVYILATRMSTWSCLSTATLCWIVAAAGLIYAWNKFYM
jgi:membrane protein GlpM